jgi:hypothetical protein
MIKHFKFSFFLTIAGIAAILCSCIFDDQNPQPPLSMTYVGNGSDTLSPFAKLAFAFSSPVASPVDFSFLPNSGQLYTITLNPGKDTVTISFLEMLYGNTRYVARLATTVSGSDDSFLSPGNDSVVFYTAFAENEPNNTMFLADTVRTQNTYGIISPASDTDYYVLPAYSSRPLCFFSSTSQDSFAIIDNTQTAIRFSKYGSKVDSVALPDSAAYPLYITVFSTIKGSTGYYKLWN